MSAVSVNISAYSATHVSSNILRGLKQIVVSSGLDASKVIGQWEVLEDGVAMWVDSSYLTRRVIEVRGGASRGKLIGRFDFAIDYGYGATATVSSGSTPIRSPGGSRRTAPTRLTVTTASLRPPPSGAPK